jgi:putative nucleotidyltransferase with HDIG domain
MTLTQANAILTEFTQNERLLIHARAVSAAMRGYARLRGEDEEAWGVVGLLHDFDYEIHPTLDEHPQKGAEILRERGVEEWIIRGVLAHAGHTGVTPETDLEKTLCAVDELSGFLIACALVRPERSLVGLEVRSVTKKMKQKAFAAAVSREEILEGAETLGVPLEEHIATVIGILAEREAELGLGAS